MGQYVLNISKMARLEGIKEGKIEGLHEGAINTLLQLLQSRFGKLSQRPFIKFKQVMMNNYMP